MDAQYFKEVEELNAWFKDKQSLVMTDDLGKDEDSCQLLIGGTVLLLYEIETLGVKVEKLKRQTESYTNRLETTTTTDVTTIETGLEQQSRMSVVVSQKQIDSNFQRMTQLARNRKQQLTDALHVHKMIKEIKSLSNWIDEKELVLENFKHLVMSGEYVAHNKLFQNELQERETLLQSLRVQVSEVPTLGQVGIFATLHKKFHETTNVWQQLPKIKKGFDEMITLGKLVQTFFMQVDESVTKIQRIKKMIDVDYFGKDLAAVKVLQISHESLQGEISDIEDNIRSLDKSISSLSDLQPILVDLIWEKHMKHKDEWESLVGKYNTIKEKILATKKALQFGEDFNDLYMWLRLRTKLLIYKNIDVIQKDAKLLLQKRPEFLSGIDDVFLEFDETARQLIETKQHNNANILEKVKRLAEAKLVMCNEIASREEVSQEHVNPDACTNKTPKEVTTTDTSMEVVPQELSFPDGTTDEIPTEISVKIAGRKDISKKRFVADGNGAKNSQNITTNEVAVEKRFKKAGKNIAEEELTVNAPEVESDTQYDDGLQEQEDNNALRNSSDSNEAVDISCINSPKSINEPIGGSQINSILHSTMENRYILGHLFQHTYEEWESLNISKGTTEDMITIFKKHETKECGWLSQAEFQRSYGEALYGHSNDPDEEKKRVYEILRIVDRSRSRKISFFQFVKAVKLSFLAGLEISSNLEQQTVGEKYCTFCKKSLKMVNFKKHLKSPSHKDKENGIKRENINNQRRLNESLTDTELLKIIPYKYQPTVVGHILYKHAKGYIGKQSQLDEKRLLTLFDLIKLQDEAFDNVKRKKVFKLRGSKLTTGKLSCRCGWSTEYSDKMAHHLELCTDSSICHVSTHVKDITSKDVVQTDRNDSNNCQISLADDLIEEVVSEVQDLNNLPVSLSPEILSEPSCSIVSNSSILSIDAPDSILALPEVNTVDLLKNDFENVLLSSDSKPIQCKNCPSSFTSKRAWKTHAEKFNPKHECTGAEPPYLCQVCNIELSSVHYYRQHHVKSQKHILALQNTERNNEPRDHSSDPLLLSAIVGSSNLLQTSVGTSHPTISAVTESSKIHRKKKTSSSRTVTKRPSNNHSSTNPKEKESTDTTSCAGNDVLPISLPEGNVTARDFDKAPESPELIFQGYQFFITEKINGHSQDEPFILPYKKNEIISLIQDNGGEIVFEVGQEQSCNVLLISNDYTETFEYVYCIAAGISCVSYLWVTRSIKDKRRWEIKPFLLPAGWSKKYKRTFCQHRKMPLKGCSILLVSNNSEFYQLWNPLLNVLHCVQPKQDGKVYGMIPLGTEVVVSDGTDTSELLHEANWSKVPVVSPEWLTQCCITGEKVEYLGYEL